MKVVINSCFGGFGLSRKGTALWCQKKGRACYFFTSNGYGAGSKYEPLADDAPDPSIWYCFDSPDIAAHANDNDWWKEHHVYGRDIARDDADLVAVVEELGADSYGHCAKLKVVEVPDGADWEIDEYDGHEHVAEKHRTWG